MTTPIPDDELLAAELARLDRKIDNAEVERRRLVDIYQAGLINLTELQRRAADVAGVPPLLPWRSDHRGSSCRVVGGQAVVTGATTAHSKSSSVTTWPACHSVFGAQRSPWSDARGTLGSAAQKRSSARSSPLAWAAVSSPPRRRAAPTPTSVGWPERGTTAVPTQQKNGAETGELASRCWCHTLG